MKTKTTPKRTAEELAAYEKKRREKEAELVRQKKARDPREIYNLYCAEQMRMHEAGKEKNKIK